MTSSTGCFLRFVAGFLAVVAVAAAIWPMLPRRYEAPTSIVLLVSNRDDDPTSAVKAMRQPADEFETQSDVDLLSSPDLSAKVAAENHLIDDREFNGNGGLYDRIRSIAMIGGLLPSRSPATAQTVRQRLLKHLTVTRDRRSYTVSFGYWSEDPAKAVVLTKSLLAAYTDAENTRKRASIDRVSHWLDDRVTNLRIQASKADDAVERFMSESGLIDKGADIFLEHQLTGLSADYAATRVLEIKDEALMSDLTALRSSGHLEDAPAVVASPIVEYLKRTRAGMAIEPGRLLSEGSGSTDQIALEASSIIRSTAAQAHIDRQRVDDLMTAIRQVREAIANRAEAKLRLAVLERDAKASHSVLEDSLIRLNGQTSLGLAIAPGIEVITESDAPLQATFPDPLTACLGTFILAVLTSGALAFRHHAYRVQSAPSFVGAASTYV